MSRMINGKANRNPKRWLMVGIYPVALFVLFFGVLFFDWMAEASESEPQDIETFSDRDVDDVLERLGIDDIDEDIVISRITELPEDIDTEDLPSDIDDTSDVVDMDEDEDADELDADDEDIDAEDDEEEVSEMDNYYYYSVLSDSEKEQYLSLYKLMESTSATQRVSFASLDDATKMYLLIKGDHPELFHVNGFNYYENGSAVSVTPDYSCDEGETISRRYMCESAANEIIDRMPSGLNEYETIKYFYEWIVDNTEYVINAADNQEITSVLLNHESVCAGYTRAIQYLLQKCGMQAMYVGGYASGAHAWLIVRIDGQYYNLDVTWADSTNPTVPHPDYAYLCLPTDKISCTHTVDEDYLVPECTSMDANFYVQEGLYVTGINDEELQEIFDKSRLEYNGTVYLMASDSGTYRALINYLLKEGNIYRFYYGESKSGNIQYYNNDDLYTLSFYR